MFSTDKVFMAMPSRVIFGCGERAAMPGLLRKLGYRNALVVTDQFFSRDSGVIAELCAGLNGVEIGSVVFDGGQPDPSVALCAAALAWTRAQAPSTPFDHIIAVGGGSNIDLAKRLSHYPQIRRQSRGLRRGRAPSRQTVAAGGDPDDLRRRSEMTPGAILIGDQASAKVALMDNDLQAGHCGGRPGAYTVVPAARDGRCRHRRADSCNRILPDVRLRAVRAWREC